MTNNTGLSAALIDRICALGTQCGAQKIVLYGSRARGDYRQRSDVDLAVVVIDGEEGMLKRVLKREGTLILQSFNASVEPRIVVGEALNDVMIVGKVVQTVRKW